MAERLSETEETKVRFPPKAYALVAQRIEQVFSTHKVAGSNPAEGIKCNSLRIYPPISEHRNNGAQERLRGLLE